MTTLADELERLKCDRHETDAQCLDADCDARFNLASKMLINFDAILAALRDLEEAQFAICQLLPEGYEPQNTGQPLLDKASERVLAAFKSARQALSVKP